MARPQEVAVAADRTNVQQFRLFPREHRLPVALIADRPDTAAPVARRLRRSRRLEVATVGLEELRTNRPWRWGDTLGGTPLAAVLPVERPGATSGAEVTEVVEAIAPVPLVVVTPARSDAALSMVEAGAEEVLSLQDGTSASLERAVLSAIYRQASETRSRRHAVDPLTGLATRELLGCELPGALRMGGTRVAVLYCDLDRFKNVNDTLGHAAGDELLVEAARRLRAAVRSSDLVVRIGGDEFVVVLIGPGPRVDRLADEVGERIVGAFRQPVELADQSCVVSMSVGLATHRSGEEADALLARADRALYLAKRRGRNRVARYDKSLDRAAAQRAGTAELLREGLRRDLLALDLHPIVDPGNARIVGHLHRPAWGCVAEATRRSVPARSAWQVARESGSAPALFRWTLRAGWAALGGHDGDGGSSSWVEMPRAVLVGGPGRVLEAVADPANATVEPLVVVIDEDDLGDSTAVRAGLAELSRWGVRAAVGRFGAALASLGLLERHPFEAVWVDRQMVDGVAECAVRRAKLQAVGHVAGALGQQLLLDRPRREEDSRVALGLVEAWMVDGALDLTAGGAHTTGGIRLPGANALGSLPRR